MTSSYNKMIDMFEAAGHDVSEMKRLPEQEARDYQVRHTSLTIAELASGVTDTIELYVKPIEKRIKELEKRIAELEARPSSMRYCGVWNATTLYAVGDVTTFDGSMWICHHDSLGNKPNETRDWQLCVKKGRDAQPRQPVGTAIPR
jgi:hypothetical protein